VVVDGRRFDSGREADYWLFLKARQTAGEITELRPQVHFPLYCPVMQSPAGAVRILQVAEYIADFTYQETTKMGGALANLGGPFTRSLREPTQSTHMLKGDRMMTMTKDRASIIDLSKETITEIDFAKKTYSTMTFAEMKQAMEALTYAEVGEKISKHTGRVVQYVDIPAGAQRKAMLDQGMPAWQVDALLDLQEYYRSGHGGAVDQLLPKLLGRQPISMDRFLAELPGEFRSQAANA